MEATSYVFVIVSVITLTQAHLLGEPELKECKAQFPIEKENIINLMMRGSLLDEKNENARCFLQCYMQNAEKMLDSSDKFDVAMAKQNLAQTGKPMFGPPGTPTPAQSVIDAAIDQCSSMSGDGKCMTNYKIWTCLHKKLHI